MTVVSFADCRSSRLSCVEGSRRFASDERGESGGRPSECSGHSRHTHIAAAEAD